jgi:hypothetical protein
MAEARYNFRVENTSLIYTIRRDSPPVFFRKRLVCRVKKTAR